MPLKKAEKSELISQYETGLASAPHAIVMGYQGIKVPQVTELRAKVRESGGEYLVVKNTLVRRAIEGKPLNDVKDVFKGPIAVAFSNGDVVSLAKMLTDFAKTAPAVEFLGGVVDGKAIAADQVKDLATLPSRDELIAKLLFLLQSPLTRLVRDLAQLTPQRLVTVLDQVAIKK
jgi:large subunit ribosomal protein L10